MLTSDVARAYRAWLLQLVPSEASEGCPRIGGLLSDHAQCFVHETKGWPASRREALLAALTKRANLGVDAEPLADAEAKELHRWSWTPSSRDAAHLLADLRVKRAQGAFRIDKKRLASVVKKEVSAALGKVHSVGGVLRWANRCSGGMVYTDVDLGGWAQMGYRHSIIAGATDETAPLMGPNVLLRGACIAHLLGDPLAQWDYLTNDQVEGVVNRLAKTCAEFVAATDKIVGHV